jgi:hypothetical protein
MKATISTLQEQYLNLVKSQGRLRKKSLQEKSHRIIETPEKIHNLNRNGIITIQNRAIHKGIDQTTNHLVEEINLVVLTVDETHPQIYFQRV